MATTQSLPPWRVCTFSGSDAPSPVTRDTGAGAYANSPEPGISTTARICEANGSTAR